MTRFIINQHSGLEFLVALPAEPCQGSSEMPRFRSRSQHSAESGESSRLQFLNSGVYIAGVTPLPIPNREVKPRRADGTIRVTVWESRSMPDIFFNAPCLKNAGHFYFQRMRETILGKAPPL